MTGESEKIPEFVLHASGRAEDIANVRSMGFQVDDDNDPAPENNPNLNQSASREEGYTPAAFKWDSICDRKANNHPKCKAKLEGINGDPAHVHTELSLFFLLFPMTWLKEVLLVMTNNNIEGKPLTFGELLRFIGIWFFMATTAGFGRREFWSEREISIRTGAPYRLKHWMSCDRFEEILSALTYTDEPAPPYSDKFWQVRQMISQWNKHMFEVFIPSWISCLDKSISIWYNRWTCPGWVFVPRKPHPFGNEYHTICCGLSRILFRLELREGKDGPKIGPVILWIRTELLSGFYSVSVSLFLIQEK